MKRIYRCFMFAGLVIVLTAAASAPVLSQVATELPLRPEPTTLPDHYPNYTDLYVNDFAGILSQPIEDDLRQRLKVLWDAGKQTTVVTITSYGSYGTSATSFEDFATNLFNYWGVGDRDSDGVMLLVAVEDRKVRIEVGSSYENTLNRNTQGIINEFILPRFRQNEYEAGVIDGTEALIRELAGSSGSGPVIVPTARSNTNSGSYTYSTSSSSDPGWGGLAAGAAGVAGAGGLGFAAYRRYARFRPRNCPSCGQTMVRLDEIEDDQFLDEGQRREEALQSVDYDAWKCTSCGTHQVFAYGALMSGYRECVQCHYRTMGTHSVVIDGADCYSSGMREVTLSCDNCGYHRVYQETIPRKDCNDNSSSSSSSHSSSSSSGGSFGGGHSSWGGSSGSW